MPTSIMPQARRAGGFSLLELLAVLALLAGMSTTLLYKTLSVSMQVTQHNTESAMASADAQLRQFAAWNGRLPCPDTSGDGVENCGAGMQKGSLPYRTLGLAAIGYFTGEQGDQALRYGVYRNPTANADLGVKAERFKPTNADGTAYDFDNKNALDFCSALDNAAEVSANITNYLHATAPNGSSSAMAYMLASPGAADADNDSVRHDGWNSTSDTGFNAHQTPVSALYDDTTRGRGLAEMYHLLHCSTAQQTLHLAANAIALEEENIAFAESNAESAAQGVMMNAVGSAITAWSMAQTAATIEGAIEVQGISIGLLAAAEAACAIPPFAGCPLVPVYITAVSAAGNGLGLSIASMILSGTSLGLQITSTVLYDNIANKAGVPDTVDSSLGITQSDLNDAETDANTANNEAQSAESAYSQAWSQYQAGPLEDANNSRTALENKISQLSPDSSDEIAIYNGLYGFPRPEDIDPDAPPDKDDVILGVEPAIDVWQGSKADAARMADVDLADEDGNSIDLAADAAAAGNKANNRIDEVRQYLITAAEKDCSDTNNCPRRVDLINAFDAHVNAYQTEREAFYVTEALKAEAEAKREEADKADDVEGALRCAFESNQDYDPETNSCKAGAPGSGATEAGNNSAICDSNSDKYNAKSCEALQESQNANPVCETGSKYYDADKCAALGTSPEPLTLFSGMDDLVKRLDSKGTVK